MKKIIATLLISIISLSSSPIYANSLELSLTAQMQKQEKLNKKNDNTKRLYEIARQKKENKDTLAEKQRALQIKRNANTIPVISPIQPTPANPLVIKRPPEITPIKPTVTTTPTVVLNTNIPVPPNVDIQRVRSAWLSMYNQVRSTEGLGLYSYDSRIDTTAYNWNIEFAKGYGLNHHRRNSSDSYYNFNTIDQWFMARGVDPKVINRSKHTENVGYGYYNCSSGDCTDKLINSIRSTFNFFMSEKGKSYDAHYRSIINPYFTKIGLSIIVVPGEQRYYLTVHYITE